MDREREQEREREEGREGRRRGKKKKRQKKGRKGKQYESLLHVRIVGGFGLERQISCFAGSYWTKKPTI